MRQNGRIVPVAVIIAVGVIDQPAVLISTFVTETASAWRIAAKGFFTPGSLLAVGGFLSRTPGCSPFVNSTPAASRACWSACLCPLLQPVSPLKPRNGVDRDFGERSKFADAQPEGRAGHAALYRQKNHNSVPIFLAQREKFCNDASVLRSQLRQMIGRKVLSEKASWLKKMPDQSTASIAESARARRRSR